MKYVLKGLEVSVKGNMINKGDLDFSLKLEEVELEGNFEEVYKELVPVITGMIDDSISNEKSRTNVEKDSLRNKISNTYNKVLEYGTDQEVCFDNNVVVKASLKSIIGDVVNFEFQDGTTITANNAELIKVICKVNELINEF